ncbi:MAG: RecQ family ATP-dependent DNA helicase, partial [bacterium]
MENILFFDLEISETRKTIKEIGAVYRGDDFRSPSFQKFRDFSHDARFICGHNIFAHDLHYLNKAYMEMDLFKKDIIDTLFFSALLFPERPYHHLVKDYRLVTEFVNDPVADAKIASRLLGDLVKRFRELPRDLKVVYYNLLDGQREFKGFFKLFKQADLPGRMKPDSLAGFIVENFKKSLCIHSDIAALITREPVEFCYAMALINTIDERSVTPPWLLYRFPKINEVLYKLRLIRCDMEGCLYCNEFLSPLNALKGLFGFFEFRSFDGDAGRPLQELVVEAALAKESLLAVFPTGGGKSLAFQLPALMMGRADRSLTVVISPLQSLMKDQVDVLEKRYDIVDAVAISGLLSPLERSQAIERVREGGAGILYISPESLRSNTILNLLKGRSINRFVIDEAHCFSSWGQDFRVDYLYIADFIAELQREKGLSQPIPVSCFTATAKPAVINDILTYFKKKLGLDLRLFKTDSKRKNLHYHVYEVHDKRSKYDTLKALLQAEEGFVIIYVSRVKTAEALAESLSRDGFNALPYHGKMPRDKKIETQSRFMEGGVRIIVATSAFGMGVDKDNVSMVIHYDISDSLENYIQESGRAGRRSDMDAGCYILYDKNDLNRHFELLNLGKMNHKQIAQIWRAIKDFKRLRFNKSSLEIAKAAGWDIELAELETRVKLAIAALEDCGYVRRGQDSPKVFATGIRVRNVQEANEKIRLNASRFSEEEMGHAIRIFQFLISREEARVDYMADVLGIERDTVARILNIFKEIELIGDTRDMTAFIDISQGKGNALHVLGNYAELEKRMASLLYPDEEHKMRKVYLKEINEHMVKEGISDCSISMIRDILRYWELRHYIKKKRIEAHTWLYEITFRCDRDKFVKEMHQRLDLTAQVMNIVFKYARSAAGREEQERKSVPFEFSMTGLKKDTECSGLFTKKLPIGDYEDVLLYLNTIGALKLERGLLICYRPMTIERVEKNSRRHYSKQEYKKLEDFYRNKVEQIHIVGEYAKMKLKDHEGAIRFIDDYFSMPYSDFIKKYFPGRKGEIRHPITEERFKMLFSALSLEQMQIIKDNSHKRILVAAGPGSGKTRVLVHKVASLLLLEDVKPEQFLMLTFSRPAAMEFKERLYKLIENTAYYIDIATYHSYAFNLLGRIGSLEESRSVIQRATETIDKKEVSLERLINKSVIVVDEYQDISSEEYAFLNAIIAAAQELRVVVVGDDDQNIYEFRGSSVKYMRSFIKDQDAVMYFLGRNYRSRKNLVDFANLFLNFLP